MSPLLVEPFGYDHFVLQTRLFSPTKGVRFMVAQHFIDGKGLRILNVIILIELTRSVSFSGPTASARYVGVLKGHRG